MPPSRGGQVDDIVCSGPDDGENSDQKPEPMLEHRASRFHRIGAGEGQDGWAAEKAICAVRYHSKVLTQLMERLDLPLARLQELKFACMRCRPGPLAEGFTTRPTAEPATCGANTDHGRWRRSCAGGMYLAAHPCCPLWDNLFSAEPPEDTAEHAGDFPDVSEAVFCSGSTEEELVLSEIEVHVCATLRHFARASQAESRLPGEGVAAAVAAAVAGAAGGGPAEAPSSKSAVAAVGGAAEEGGELDGNGHLEAIAEETGAESGLLGDLGAQFASCSQGLVDIVWAFFLYIRLVEAILRGDVLLAAGWAVRFLGIAGPWSLRRLHELVVHALEIAAEHPFGPPGRGVPESLRSAQSDAEEEASLPESARFFQKACLVYISVPVIPRFEARLRRSIARLRGKGVFKDPDGGCEDSKMQKSLSVYLSDGPELTGEAPKHDFDGTGKGLEAFRAKDNVHVSLQHTLTQTTLAEHSRDACTLQVQKFVLVGAEAAVQLSGGATWPEARRRQFLEVLGSVPQRLRPQPQPRKLEELEACEAGLAARRMGYCLSGIGLDDVNLDLANAEADLQDGDPLHRCAGNGQTCGGFFCDPLDVRAQKQKMS